MGLQNNIETYPPVRVKIAFESIAIPVTSHAIMNRVRRWSPDFTFEGISYFNLKTFDTGGLSQDATRLDQKSTTRFKMRETIILTRNMLIFC